MKQISIAVIMLLFVLVFAACQKEKNDVPQTTSKEVPTTIEFAKKDTTSDFKIVYGADLDQTDIKIIRSFADMIKESIGVDLQVVDDTTVESACEIIINSTSRSESARLTESIADGEYAIKALADSDSKSILVSAKGSSALSDALLYLVSAHIDSEKGVASMDVSTDLKRDSSKLYVAKRGETPFFVIKYGKNGEKAAKLLKSKLNEQLGVDIELVLARGSKIKMYPFEIDLSSDSDFYSGIETFDAGTNEYSISVSSDASSVSLHVYSSDVEGECMAILSLLSDYLDSESGEFYIPKNINKLKLADAADYALYEDYIRNGNDGEITDKDLLVGMVIRREGAAETIRDPNLLYENGNFYMYYSSGGVWYCSVSQSLYGPWENPKTIAVLSDFVDKYGINARKYDYNWAPEIHKYKDNYYLFTTYWCCEEDHNSPYEATWSPYVGHRAVVIMKSDNPFGPFVPISKDADGNLGHSTPGCWDTIDATLYIDDEGQPWTVFSHEWTSSPDAVGSFYAAKLSDDLSSFIGEPIQIFTANARIGNKNTNGVPDGANIYKSKDGQLICLWSSFYDGGYVVIQAVSKSGSILGPWTQERELLYDSTQYKDLAGGHPSIVTDESGQMYLVLHSPNGTSDDRPGVHECPTFVPIIEKNNRLIWGLNAKSKD